MTRSRNYLDTQSELIRSTQFLNPVIEDPNYNFSEMRTFGGQGQKPVNMGQSRETAILIGDAKDKPDVVTDKPEDGVLDNRVMFLKNNLHVSIGRQDGILGISFTSRYPEEAGRIVNAVVEYYKRFQDNQKKTTAGDILDLLQEQRDKKEKQLRTCYDELLAFTKIHGMISMESNYEPVALTQFNRLSESLTEARYETIRAKVEYDIINGMSEEGSGKSKNLEKLKRFAMEQGGGGGVNVFVTDVETQLRSEKRALEIELKSVQEFCTEDHPAMQALLSKISKVSDQLEEEVGNLAGTYLDVTRSRWEAAKQRESQLQLAVEEQREKANKLSKQAADHYILMSNLKRTEKLLSILDDRIKEINVTENVGALSTYILEVARPGSPLPSQKARIMANALIMGLILGCGVALLRELLDSRLRSADEIAAALDLPVVGIVPMMSKRLSVQDRGQNVYKQPMSYISEAFRTIRTALFFGVPKGQGQVFLITSPSPGEGKSSVVSNLGISMAQSGQKTLIIDGDLRKPMQHKIFEIDKNTQGLCATLSGQTVLSDAIQKSLVDDLDILPSPSGPNVPNPSEMLNSTTFSEIVKTLRKQYDRILIDSPPVTSVADSHILAAMCDTTLVVVRAESSKRRHSRQARDTLLSVGANIFGVIVNAVSKQQDRYGYYSYKYYGNDNSQGKKEDQQ